MAFTRFHLLTLACALTLSVPLLTQCTAGALPTGGKLPGADGSQLTNVSASSVGGITANQVAGLNSAIGSATDGSTASTLVKRDANGNFSAGTITGSLNGSASTAGFALGQMGGALNAASTLALGNDGSFFKVNGSSAIGGINPLPAGSNVQLLFTGTPTLVHDGIKFVLQGKGSFTVSPGDVFTFVSLGSGNWMEISRKVSRDSEVFTTGWAAVAVIGRVLLNNPTQIVSNTQSEYSASAGAFTANQAGMYQYSASWSSSAGNWAQGTACFILAIVTSQGVVTYNRFNQFYVNANTSAVCTTQLASSVRLLPGDTLVIQAATSQVAISVAGVDGGYNYFHIFRVSN